MSQLDRASNRDDTDDSFVDLSLDEALPRRSTHELADRLETVNFSDSIMQDLQPQKAAHHNTHTTLAKSNGHKKAIEQAMTPTMGADDVLDDLTSSLDSPTETSSGGETVLPIQLHQPEPDPIVQARHYSTSESRYDHLFEEVSLDLPRDPNPVISSPTSSKLFKFISRKPSPPTSADDNKFTESSVDLSGPFYSISDVLEDGQAVVGPRSGGTTMKVGKSTPSLGARRGVQQNDIIAKSGGSSAKGLKRRSRQVLL